MKTLLVSLLLFIALLNHACSSSPPVELITDLNFSDGIALQAISLSDPVTIDTLYPFGRGTLPPEWKLVQLFSRFNLNGVSAQRLGGNVVYANAGKRISFKKCNGSTEVGMEVFGSKEYRAPRKYGQGWPHLLLLQTIVERPNIDSIRDLHLSMEARLMFCHNKMMPSQYNPNLHTAQFSLYLVIRNVNRHSSDYRDYFWFGLHLYDYRWKRIPSYAARDKGKKGATGKFIYCPASHEVYAGSFQSGRWVNISKDILPWIKEGFKTAQAEDYLKGSSLDDMAITAMNIGWEVPGTFNCGLQYKDLRLEASRVK